MDSDDISLGGVTLHREGRRIVVSVRLGGRWVPVISEDYEAPINHFVSPSGIRACVDRHPDERMGK